MTKDSAIKHFGSASALANALGVTVSAVSQWDEVPEGQQYKLQVLTAGKLQATPRPKAQEAQQ